MAVARAFVVPARPIGLVERVGLDRLYLAAVLFTATGAMSRFGVDTPVWIALYGGAVWFILRDWRLVEEGLRRSWPALLVPAVAGLSTLWSLSPGQTLYSSVQLTMTVLIGLWAGSRFTLQEIFQALALGAGLGVALSVVNLGAGVLPAWMNGSFIGIYAQKNVFAKVALLFYIGASVWALSDRKPLGVPAYLGLVLGILGLVLLANSTSTLAFYAFALSGVALWAIGVGRPAERALRLAYALFVVGGAALFAVFGFPHLIEAVLAAAEKDATLTGRTVLWAHAEQVMAERPWLGVGFNAFWDPKINGIVAVIRETVDPRIRGFHNVYIEATVATGLLGAVAFGAFLAAALWRALRGYVRTGDLAAATLLMLTALTLVIGGIENVMFRPHEIFQILMVAGFAAAAQPPGEPRHGP